MTYYRLKITIFGIPKLYRRIDISGNNTLEELHEAIFAAFDRFDPHLYSFFITRKDTKSIRAIYNAPEITHPQNTESFMDLGATRRSAAKTRVSDLDLAEKDVIHYLFDFGDDWWHRIRVEQIFKAPGKAKLVKVVKAVGASPKQYPDYDDEDE